jgi:hypothetical protein
LRISLLISSLTFEFQFSNAMSADNKVLLSIQKSNGGHRLAFVDQFVEAEWTDPVSDYEAFL